MRWARKLGRRCSIPPPWCIPASGCWRTSNRRWLLKNPKGLGRLRTAAPSPQGTAGFHAGPGVAQPDEPPGVLPDHPAPGFGGNSQNPGRGPRPAWRPTLWERYVESRFDFRSEPKVLQEKFQQTGQDGARMLAWNQGLDQKFSGRKVRLLARVWEEQFELVQPAAPAKPTGTPKLGRRRSRARRVGSPRPPPAYPR